MTAPRVLLCARPDLLSKPGGDTRQILGLRRHLPRAALSLELHPDLRRTDVVHVFNLSRPLEPALQAEHARRAGIPVVCSTIYQDLREYNRRGRRGAGRLLFRLCGQDDERLEDLRAVVNLMRSGRRAWRPPSPWPRIARQVLRPPGLARELQRRLLASSQLLVFGSRLEAETVQRRFPEHRHRPHAVVPVGIDPREFATLDPGPFRQRFGIERFVLAVGRIEDLKNQLALIRALDHRPLPLVLVGPVNPLHRSYARAVARAAARRPRTLLLHALPRPLLLSAMAAAAVHVLASWFETTGLVSLEAAAAGSPVVSTDRGYAREALGDLAAYCDPAAPPSILAAIEVATTRGPTARLRERVINELTEERAARELTRLYRQLAS